VLISKEEAPLNSNMVYLVQELRFGMCVGVLEEQSIAEAGRQHVALRPRRIAGKQLGLALTGCGRESMSEAGSQAQC